MKGSNSKGRDIHFDGTIKNEKSTYLIFYISHSASMIYDADADDNRFQFPKGNSFFQLTSS